MCTLVECQNMKFAAGSDVHVGNSSAAVAAVHAVFDHALAEHEYLVKACRRQVGPRVRALLMDIFGREEQEVRVHARRDDALFLKAEAVRRMPRHLVHGLLKREYTLLHDVFFNEPRECAVHARVDTLGYVASEMTPENGARRISFTSSSPEM